MKSIIKTINRLFKKSIHILFEEGPKALWKAYQEHRKFQKITLPKIGEPLDKKSYDTKAAKFYGRTIYERDLIKALTELEKPVVLAISQDNYLEVTGGVQLTIDKDAKVFLDKGLNFLHIFPYWARNTLDFSTGPSYYGISLNNKLLGFVEERTLLDVFNNTIPEKLNSLHIHHTMGFRLSFLDHLLTLNGQNPARFWIHDFITLCPNCVLLRNDIEFCNAPPLNSNACTICKYSSIRPKHVEGYVTLFKKFNLQVIAPSQFALDFWLDHFPLKGIEGIVKPHGQFIHHPTTHKRTPTDPIKIAFLGFPVFHKGWRTWLKLTDTFCKYSQYQFFLFSNEKKSSAKFKNISVTVDAEDPKAMVKALRKQQIDVAFLWSIWPETYSYTLEEALAAGVFVITNPHSGNIYAQVHDKPYGICLKNEAELMSFFEQGQLSKYLSG